MARYKVEEVELIVATRDLSIALEHTRRMKSVALPTVTRCSSLRAKVMFPIGLESPRARQLSIEKSMFRC
jgi:hypothetical protein